MKARIFTQRYCSHGRFGIFILFVLLLQATFSSAQNPGELFVVEKDLPGPCGGLFRIGRQADGTVVPRSRTLISDFCNPAQGVLGVNPTSVIVDPSANNFLLVIDPDAGTNGRGMLFDVRVNDGFRFAMSDFGDPLTGVLGIDPSSLVAFPGGRIFVLDKNSSINSVGRGGGGGVVYRIEGYTMRSFYSFLDGMFSVEPTNISYDSSLKMFSITDPVGGESLNGITIGIRDAFSGVPPSPPFLISHSSEGSLVVPGTASGSGFSGSWDFLRQACRQFHGALRCRLSGRLNITNPGTKTAARSVVRYYLSNDNLFDPFDQAIAESDQRPLPAGVSRRENVRIDLGQSASGKFVIAALDAENNVAEINEENNLIVSEVIP